jgi:hypothetical protein
VDHVVGHGGSLSAGPVVRLAEFRRRDGQPIGGEWASRSAGWQRVTCRLNCVGVSTGEDDADE